MRPTGWSLATLAALGVALALSACGDARPPVGGGGGGTGCTGCHGTAGRTGFLSGTDPDLAAAPPIVPAGTSASAEGLHELHVNPVVAGAIRGPLACGECHIVPTDSSHATNPPASPVVFGDIAIAQGVVPVYSPNPTPGCSATYCHGNFAYGTVLGNGSNPVSWTATAAPSCTNCHGLPPSGHIPLSAPVTPATCAGCHPQTVKADGSINVATGAHINGQKDVQVTGCTVCHGTTGRTGDLPGTDLNLAAAPPVAPAGAPAAVVGAHQAHLNPPVPGSPTPPLTGPLACSECHIVPTDFAHATSPPAQIVVFGPLATAPVVPTDGVNPGTPTWNGIATPTCSSVYCHGSFRWLGNGQNGGDVTGNAFTPDWTKGSGQAVCGSCHDLPPVGHVTLSGTVTASTCNGCHPGTVAPDGTIVVDLATGQSLHVNGKIDEGAHPTGWADPSQHGAKALDFTAPATGLTGCLQCHVNYDSPVTLGDPTSSCNDCHALALTSATTKNWQQNCVFCHGDQSKIATWTAVDPQYEIAPPRAASTSVVAVGAHTAHLYPANVTAPNSLPSNTLATALTCNVCHVDNLNPFPTDLTHVNGVAEVPLAGTLGPSSVPVGGTWNGTGCAATYCHGNYPQGGANASPTWTAAHGTFSTCTSCHGAPPATGQHAFHVQFLNCSFCHNGIATGSGTPLTNGAIVLTGGLPSPLHVNGNRDVVFGGNFGGSPFTATWTANPIPGNAAGGSCTASCHSSPTVPRDW